MGLESGGDHDTAQAANAGSFQAEATGLLHAGQATKPAQGHESTAKSALHDASIKPVSHDASIEPASPPSALKPGDSAARLESGMLPGLNTDHLHNSARELLFQHNSHGVPVAFQPHNDVASAGLPQINIFNSSNQTELHTGVKNNLAPHDDETAPPHDTPPAPTDGNHPSPQNGEIKVENYAVKKGDSLWKIAREHLEHGASNREVNNYVHQIEADNPMPNPDLIKPGEIIELHGYVPPRDTAHGAPEHDGMTEHYYVRQHRGYHTDYGGKVYPYSRDNNNQHDSENRRHDNNGNDHQLPLPDTTHRKAAPQYDGTKDPPLPPPPHNDAQSPSEDKLEKTLEPFKDTPITLNIEQDRRQLAELAHNRMGDGDEYSKFVDSMNSFEHRVNSNLADKLRLQGKNPEEVNIITAQEIHDTYKNAGDLLRTPSTDKLTPVELQHLASEEMQQAAYSTHIDEGQHETCQTDVVEEYAYTLAPAEATKLVTEIALTGKYTASDGTVIKVDPTPHDLEALNCPVKDGQRSHASQIFQETAINLAWAKKDPSGKTQFVWAPYNPKQQSPAGEELLRNGKRVTHSGNLAIESGAPAMVPQDLTMVSNLITGRHDKSIVVASPTSPQDLQVKVQELEQHGRLPAVFYVFTGQGQTKPFSNAEPGVHTVLLGGYISTHNGEPRKIIVDNSWGSAWDRKYGVMDVNTLYQATQNQRGTKDNVREKGP